MKSKELLDILAEERINGILEEVLKKDDLYKKVQKEHDLACEELEKTGFSIKQKRVIDYVISTANQCGAVYGAIAYRQGLEDGVKLVAEIGVSD